MGNQADEVDHSVNLYLLPEGAKFPETREEGAGFGNVETYSYLNEITDDLGMQLVGSWDLGSTGSNEDDFNNGDEPMRIWDARLPSPEFISDTPISGYDIEVDEIVEGITPIARPDLLVDGHVGVVSIQPNDYSTAFCLVGLRLTERQGTIRLASMHMTKTAYGSHRVPAKIRSPLACLRRLWMRAEMEWPTRLLCRSLTTTALTAFRLRQVFLPAIQTRSKLSSQKTPTAS